MLEVGTPAPDFSLPDPERRKIFPMQKRVGLAAGNVEVGCDIVGIQGELPKRGVEFSFFFHIRVFFLHFIFTEFLLLISRKPWFSRIRATFVRTA